MDPDLVHIREFERAREAFEQAQRSCDPDDLVAEKVLYDAAKEFAKKDFPRPLSAARAIARIDKRRWRRDPTDLSSLRHYLAYLGEFGDRRWKASRIAAAKTYERVASIVVALAPIAKDETFLQLIVGLCERAATQYMVAEQPLRARAPAKLALERVRSFVADGRQTGALLAALRVASKVAFASRDYKGVIEFQEELIRIKVSTRLPKTKKSPLARKVISSQDEFAISLQAHTRLVRFSQLSERDKETVLIFVHRFPAARSLGEDYRLLGQAQAAAGMTFEAMKSFDLATEALRSELASENNRLLGLDIVLEAIEVCRQHGDVAECVRRARDGVAEAKVLKAHGASVPQLAALLAHTSDKETE